MMAPTSACTPGSWSVAESAGADVAEVAAAAGVLEAAEGSVAEDGAVGLGENMLVAVNALDPVPALFVLRD